MIICAMDNMMATNMGDGLPIYGFYEMKQDIYEIAMVNKEEAGKWAD